MLKLSSGLRHSRLFLSSCRSFSTNVALVVGAGLGIGSALVKRFAAEGLSVVAVRRNESLLQPLVDEITSQGGQCTGLSCDIRKENEVKALIENIESNIGQINVAVHNVGANIGSIPLKDVTAKKYFKVWEMAAFSAFLFGREVSLQMEARERGTIIFTGATASLRGSAGHSAFSGGMMGKRALAQSMARELGPKGVHVAHVIIDGVVNNPNTRSFFELNDLFDEMAGKDGILNPDDVAGTYWHIHNQPKSVWTHELDLRPWVEKW